MNYIITLSGMLGSGKSTVGKMIAEKLGYTFYSTGSVQRQIAQERGITTLELNRLALTDKSIDDQIDGVFKTLPLQPNNFVVDSRMAFFFIPVSFKVKLNIDTTCAGERIFNDTTRTGEKKYKDVAEAIDSLIQRRKLEVERFKKLYQVDIDNEDNFDFVIDTTDKTPQEVVDKILQKFSAYQSRLRRS